MSHFTFIDLVKATIFAKSRDKFFSMIPYFVHHDILFIECQDWKKEMEFIIDVIFTRFDIIQDEIHIIKKPIWTKETKIILKKKRAFALFEDEDSWDFVIIKKRNARIKFYEREEIFDPYGSNGDLQKFLDYYAFE